ncbi:hypothetical protein R3P38DRAFT_3228007 [Favolaschia claudopus]|uniref:Uncharacterized protein n=1 Tax=Favolaschia claudopus TaxID=2862362 RepID=A0AAV9ZSI9_9AGAR
MTSNYSPATIHLESLPQVSEYLPPSRLPARCTAVPHLSCPWRDPSSIVCTNSLRISGARIFSAGVSHPTAQPYDGCSTGGNVSAPPSPLAHHPGDRHGLSHPEIRNTLHGLPYACSPCSISDYAL